MFRPPCGQELRTPRRSLLDYFVALPLRIQYTLLALKQDGAQHLRIWEVVCWVERLDFLSY